MNRASRSLKIKVLLILSALLLLVPAAVHARLLCRSDPVVTLSNGVILDLSATISTLPWQVTEVHYELHVPQGVSLVLAVHTPTWLTSQETFTVIADQPQKTYVVNTTVRTTTGNATFSGDALLVQLLGLKIGAYSQQVREGSTATVTFRSR
jgi:hypothetical protein